MSGARDGWLHASTAVSISTPARIVSHRPRPPRSLSFGVRAATGRFESIVEGLSSQFAEAVDVASGCSRVGARPRAQSVYDAEEVNGGVGRSVGVAPWVGDFLTRD